MLRTFCLALCIMCTSGLSGQQHQCAFDHYVHSLNQVKPAMNEQKELILSRDDQSTLRSAGEVYTIRTVVHLVENGSKPPITDRQVEDVIAVLNADFGRTNADTINLRPIFHDVAGNPGIAFDLTNIIRIQTDTLFEFGLTSLPDYVKQTRNGGSDAVDPTHFMNIWVCSVEGGALLGYAYPPEGLAHWPAGSSASAAEFDGIVIHDEAFQSFGQLRFNNSTMEMRGRTITHEIGHYLGLRHIWGMAYWRSLVFPTAQMMTE